MFEHDALTSPVLTANPDRKICGIATLVLIKRIGTVSRANAAGKGIALVDESALIRRVALAVERRRMWSILAIVRKLRLTANYIACAMCLVVIGLVLLASQGALYAQTGFGSPVIDGQTVTQQGRGHPLILYYPTSQEVEKVSDCDDDQIGMQKGSVRIGRMANLALADESRQHRGLATALCKWLRLAEQGDLIAQFNLGNLYAYGNGVPQDDSLAVEWYRKAADQRHAPAQYNLGVMYAKGKGVTHDYTKAAHWYLKAAEQGVVAAQFNLGVMYASGLGVPQDHALAMRWYAIAAEHGHAPAQTNLAVMYAKGQGVALDNVEAVKWYRRAAEQGHAPAQTNLGIMYAKGQGVAQNYAEAVKWYLKAASGGHAPAQYNIGVAYREGRGVPQNFIKAVQWFTKAADQGYVPAQFNLGVMYKTGRGVPQNFAEAIKWYRKAADQNDAQAQNNLGLMFYNGLGVRRDLVKAYMWVTLAVTQGAGERAKANLELFATQMTPAQVLEARHMAQVWSERHRYHIGVTH